MIRRYKIYKKIKIKYRTKSINLKILNMNIKENYKD